MLEKTITDILLLISLNGIISCILILSFQLVAKSFHFMSIVSWFLEDIKKFAINVLSISIILMITGKYQLNIIKNLEQSNPKAITVIKYSFIVILTIIVSLITSYNSQYFQFSLDAVATDQWILANIQIFIASALVFFFIYLFMFSLIGEIYISSIITSILILTLGYVHYQKLNFRMEPLYPSDLSQIKQVIDIIPMIGEYISFTTVIVIVIVIGALLYLLRFLPKANLRIWMRVILLVVTTVMLYSIFYFPETFMKKYIEDTKVDIVKWNQLENYSTNGFVFGFISNLHTDVLDRPKGYSKKLVLETADKYIISNGNQSEVEKPNIIFLMNEAFWDPIKLANVQFSSDPLKNFRSLLERHSGGYSLSPVFGGGTANVEFEALTGLSNYFLKVGSIPYQDVIDKKAFIPTIASELNSIGYKSLAIHPYNKVFYKRNKVYQTFGFNHFLDMEKMKYKEVAGTYRSDESLSKEIIYQVMKQKEPLFIHAVSMQNHQSYPNDRYENTEIKVVGLSEESKGILEIYTEGVNQADDAMQLLVNKLEKLGEPTIIVFWGDHLPSLGPNLQVFKEANYSNANDKNLYEKELSETPLLFYANYPINKQEIQTLSPIYFGPIVFDMAGLKKPSFYNLLDKIKLELPGLKDTIQINGNQQFVTGKLTRAQKELLADYKLIQYDLLIGKQYSKNILFSK
ncbi:LTA synthase family protein [Neobacillus sp. K501]